VICEKDKEEAVFLQEKFPEAKFHDDLFTANPDKIPDHDLFCAGFPCQSFSMAGKRTGFKDTRGTVFFEILRILKRKRPKIILLENVKGLLSAQDGYCFFRILECLGELGYFIQWQVLNSFWWLPQSRERVFIIGINRKECFKKILPIRESINWDYSKEEGRFIAASYIPTLTKAYQGLGFAQPLIKDSFGIRRLTERECERFQGFPDDWTISLKKRYSALGNAVSVPVISAVIRAIFNA